MYYNNNSEPVIDLFSNKGARQTVSYVPGTPLTFKMRFSNADKLERVFVGSSKGVEEKKMEAKPSGKTGEYVASGFFDKNDQNYLPGTVYVMYQTATNAYESIGAVDFDGEEVSETWKNPDHAEYNYKRSEYEAISEFPEEHFINWRNEISLAKTDK